VTGFSCPTWVRAALLAAVVAAGTGCPSVLAGHGQPAPIPVGALCPRAGEAAPAVVRCLSEDIGRMWTGWAGKPVESRVTVDPAPRTVHRDCAAFLAFGTAFYCPPDGRTYVTGAAVARDRREFGDRLPYALAVILAHEAGHRVQYVLDVPGVDDSGDAASRRIEQQADCLAGVWAHDAAVRARLEPAVFRDVERRELTLISRLTPPPGTHLDGYDETRTHGTVAQRVAAFDRGYAGGPPACGISLPAQPPR
jgi:predicted metalloprotease